LAKKVLVVSGHPDLKNDSLANKTILKEMKDKVLIASLTTGAGEAAYSAETGTTIDELLAPIRLTAKLTQLNFAGHVVTHDVSYSLRNDAEKAQEMIAKSQEHARKLVVLVNGL